MSIRGKTLLLIFMESFLLFASLVITLGIKSAGSFEVNYLLKHIELFAFIFPIWQIFLFIEGLYNLKTINPNALVTSLLRGLFLAAMFTALFFYFMPKSMTTLAPKTNLALIAIISFVLIFLWRKNFYKFFSKSSFQRKTLILGPEAASEFLIKEIENKPFLGYRIDQSLNLKDADVIALDRNYAHDKNILDEVFSYLGTDKTIMELASFSERVSGKVPIKSIDEVWFIQFCGEESSRSYQILKNLLDKGVAIILFIILFPFFIIGLPILLIVHGKPIFFKQVRTGLNNKPFTLYKFRTMVIDAEKDGAKWATKGDARITPLGKFLRKTRIDELPQLINILRGEMSLVGPRPERPEMIERELSNISFYNLRHLVKPGVTGWAQVNYKYGASIEDSIEKLQYDLYYVKNKSIWLDILTILKTVKTVISGAGQ